MQTRKWNAMTWLAVALVIAIGLMVLLGTLSMSTYGGYFGMMGGGSWAWGFLMMAVPGVFLVVVLVAALGGLGTSAAVAGERTALGPLEILDQRYARGELSREEYLRTRNDLAQSRADS